MIELDINLGQSGVKEGNWDRPMTEKLRQNFHFRDLGYQRSV